MTDPTIPELVARLRELRARAPYKDVSICRIESELGKTAFYVPNVYEADDLRVWDLADLITETLNALPTLLDALERQPSGEALVDPLTLGKILRVAQFVADEPWDVTGADEDTHVFACEIRDLLVNETTEAYTEDAAPKGEAIDLVDGIMRAAMLSNWTEAGRLRHTLGHLLSGGKRGHSPDGGKVEELNHDRCGSSTGIDGLLTAGQGELDEYGQWSIPCDRCLARVATGYAAALEDRIAHLESLTTWRPISEPPSAEVHAWCGGRYLLKTSCGLQAETWPAGAAMPGHWESWTDRYATLWLPIPPSDERRG